jgi:hypothetical protein
LRGPSTSSLFCVTEERERGGKKESERQRERERESQSRSSRHHQKSKKAINYFLEIKDLFKVRKKHALKDTIVPVYLSVTHLDDYFTKEKSRRLLLKCNGSFSVNCIINTPNTTVWRHLSRLILISFSR